MAIELTMGIHVGEENISRQFYKEWVNKLNRMSEDELRVNIVYNHFVGIEEWNMLKSGKIDMGRVFTLNMEPFPMHTVPALPFMIPLDSRNLTILNSIYESFLYKEWNDVKVLWLGLMSPYHIHTSNKMVEKLDDLHGLRIQASGMPAELIKVWGGIPVELTAMEGSARQDIKEAQYNAMKTGLIDGTIGTFEVVNDFRLYEVTRYHTILNVIRDVNGTVINREVWEKLPYDIQRVFEDSNLSAQQGLDMAQARETDEGRDLCEGMGHGLIDLPPDEYASWVKACGKMIDEVLAKLDAKGLPATAIADEINRLASQLPEEG
jgi:TRAP-type C4-dicarboxylate transport system substrate-binding protein